MGQQAELVDLDLNFDRRLARRAGERYEERFCDLRFRFGPEHGDAVVVVPERLELAAFDASVDQQHDHDQDDDGHPRGDPASDHQRVLIAA